MHRFSLLPALAGACVLVVACDYGRADVTAASLLEQVNADVDGPDTKNFVIDDFQDHTTLPPIGLSASEDGVFSNLSSDSSVTIISYLGPLSPTGSTSSLDMNVLLSAYASSAGSPDTATADAGYTYQFTLTAAQPYTYSTTGTLAVTTFTNPSNAGISPGSGTLLPGTYALSSFYQGALPSTVLVTVSTCRCSPSPSRLPR